MTRTTAVSRPALANPLVQSVFADDEPLGPFINASPRLVPGQRFVMGLNVVVAEPVTIRLTSSDPSVASVPEALPGSPDYYQAMFEIVGHAVGTTTITARLGDAEVATRATVRPDTTEIKNLVGPTPIRPAGQFVYELGTTGTELTINMSGPVVEERIATITSSTPEVASVPARVVIPRDSNWPQSFPVQLHAVGTSLITVSCRGVTLETMIEVIPPPLWIASIDVSGPHLRAGDEFDLTITMTGETFRETAVTIERHPQLHAPTGLLIPRGERSGTIHVRVLETLDGTKPLAIRWLHSLYVVSLAPSR